MSETGKALMCRICTDVGKPVCGTMGEDAKFMTDVQFTVEPNSTGTEWILTHSLGRLGVSQSAITPAGTAVMRADVWQHCQDRG